MGPMKPGNQHRTVYGANSCRHFAWKMRGDHYFKLKMTNLARGFFYCLQVIESYMNFNYF